MTTQQSYALYLADELELGTFVPNVLQNEAALRQRAAAELRRLHAYCQQLESQVILDCMTHVQNPAEIEHVAGDVSKNGAGLNMSTQHARITELESQLARRFDAADMATAAAQGFMDGVASVSSGSEPVAWQYRSVRDKGIWFDCTEERAQQRAAHPDKWDVRYLYTHPSPPEGMAGWKWVPIEPTDAMWNAMMDWGTKKSEWLAILDAAPGPADGESNV